MASPRGKVPSLPKCKTTPPGKTRSISSSPSPGHQRGKSLLAVTERFSERNSVHAKSENAGEVYLDSGAPRHETTPGAKVRREPRPEPPRFLVSVGGYVGLPDGLEYAEEDLTPSHGLTGAFPLHLEGV